MTDQQYRNSVHTLCQKISKDRLIIQGAGGNVSWKTETHLWIKLSGTWIEDAQNKDIFGSISLDKLNELIKQEKFNVDPAMMDQDNVRPSIEIMLHAIINKRYVFHLHMVEVVAALINNPERLLVHLAKHDLSAQIIPYYKPGEELAMAVYRAIKQHQKTDLLCLENHGVVLFSDDINDIKSQVLLLQQICQIELTKIRPINNRFSNAIGNSQYELIDNSQINSLVFLDDLFAQLEHLWPICPDHIVFLGSKPYLYDTFEEFLDSFKVKYQPKLIFVRKKGVYINKKNFTKIHFIQLQFFADVLLRLNRFQNVPVISEIEIHKLLNWDAERYRQQANQ